jgi:hypothetical protein
VTGRKDPASTPHDDPTTVRLHKPPARPAHPTVLLTRGATACDAPKEQPAP